MTEQGVTSVSKPPVTEKDESQQTEHVAEIPASTVSFWDKKQGQEENVCD